MNKPTPDFCRATDSPVDDGAINFVWTLRDGRGLIHPHDDTGCPFRVGGRWEGQAEQVAGSVAGETCSTCGRLHEGRHA